MTVVYAGTALCAEPGDYQSAPEFLKLPKDWTLGPCSAVEISPKGEICLLHRGPHPILMFDAQGTFLRSWGDDLIKTAHGIRIDRDGNVWVTDIGNHRVFKFDSVGKLLLALGTGKPGPDDDQFNKPTDVAFGPAGEFYVSDGYVNTRVMKFSPQGTLIKSWGKPGKGPGEFDLVHSIIVDRKNRILVGDRMNERIQLFDSDGKFLEAWTGFAPYGMAIRSDGTVFVATGSDNTVICLDSAGKIQQTWGGKGTGPGQFQIPHMLAFDTAGNLFVAEVDGLRLQKLIRK
jgi:DNA-binding beta-propeller fold protein YncE